VRLQFVEQVGGEVDGPAAGVGLSVLDAQDASGKIDGAPAQLAKLTHAKPTEQHRGEKGSMLAGQAVNIGRDLRQRLEAVAREQGADGTYLGRKALREYVEQRERGSAGRERD
jgi:hypothetical protein